MKQFQLTLLAIIITGLFVACSDDDNDNVDTEFLATQAGLNASTNVIMADITGGQFGAHNGTGISNDSTYRDIFANRTDLSSIPKGTIITKKTHKKLSDGSKGDLQVAFAMIKRESGYDSDNQDWEYVMMPFDADNDYNANPFGKLPDVGADSRGKLAMCIDCHSAAPGGDFTWAND
jgi:hypothetical protein